MPKKDKVQNEWHEPLQMFARVSGWVAGPVIISLFVGKYLDDKFGTEPFAFIALTGFAFFVSCFGIVKETLRYIKDLEKKHGNTTHNSDKS